MRKEFIKYEQALALKELGFDEPCQLGWYLPHSEIAIKAGVEPDTWQLIPTHPLLNQIAAATFSQAFRWFREKYAELDFGVAKIHNGTNNYHYHINLQWEFFEGTYEEAELACLDKLIEIVKKQ